MIICRQPTNPEIGRSANIAARRLELVLKLERRHQISCEELIRNASSSDAREVKRVMQAILLDSYAIQNVFIFSLQVELLHNLCLLTVTTGALSFLLDLASTKLKNT